MKPPNKTDSCMCVCVCMSLHLPLETFFSNKIQLLSLVYLLFYNFASKNLRLDFWEERYIQNIRDRIYYFTVQFVELDIMKVLRFHFQFVCCVSATLVWYSWVFWDMRWVKIIYVRLKWYHVGISFWKSDAWVCYLKII